MKLFVNGCSHTEGTELALDGDLTQAWPYKLQQLLQYDELHNSSCAGGSNDRIVRTTIESIAGSAIPPDLAVIQFTESMRFETPDNLTNSFKQFIPRTYQLEEYTSLVNMDPSEQHFVKKHYNMSNTTQKLLVQEKMLTQMLAIQNLLQNYDIPYVFIIWWKMLTGIESKRVYKTIDKSNLLNCGADGKIIPMDNILHSNGYKLCKKFRPDGTRDKHYMPPAQQFLAESIFKFVTYGEHLLCKGDIGDQDYQEVHHYYD